MSPELRAQIEEGRRLAQRDRAENPAEPQPPQAAPSAPAPRPAPTITHRATRGIRRALGALLGGNDKTE